MNHIDDDLLLQETYMGISRKNGSKNEFLFIFNTINKETMIFAFL